MNVRPRVLLVNNNEDVLRVFRDGLEMRGLETVPAMSAPGALRLIASQPFDALLSDLRPDPRHVGEAVVVSTMHKLQPRAVTVVLESGRACGPFRCPTPTELVADRVLIKPVALSAIVRLVQRQLLELGGIVQRESVAAVLQREQNSTTQNYVNLVEHDPELQFIEMSYWDRSAYLPMLFDSVITRLRLPRAPVPQVSISAGEHGAHRRRQGYSPAMVVQESRLLQASFLNTLQKNLQSLDFNQVLLDVITITDELDSQLKQSIRECTKLPIARTRIW